MLGTIRVQGRQDIIVNTTLSPKTSLTRALVGGNWLDSHILAQLESYRNAERILEETTRQIKKLWILNPKFLGLLK